MLEKEDCFHWKVKMHLNLMSLETSFMDYIERGVHVLLKIATRLDAMKSNRIVYSKALC